MSGFMERRMNQRYDRITPDVRYSVGPKNETHTAMLVNCCEGGIYLKTKNALEIGQSVSIKMPCSQYETIDAGRQARYKGKIRWAESYQNDPEETLYGYGIEYDQPVQYP